MNGVSKPDSCQARSRHEQFFYDTEFSSVLYSTLVLCVSLFSEKKRERVCSIKIKAKTKTQKEKQLYASLMTKENPLSYKSRITEQKRFKGLHGLSIDNKLRKLIIIRVLLILVMMLTRHLGQ